jgi:hypothetical protein
VCYTSKYVTVSFSECKVKLLYSQHGHGLGIITLRDHSKHTGIFKCCPLGLNIVFFFNAVVVWAYGNFVRNKTTLGIVQLNLLQFCIFGACRVGLYVGDYYSGYIGNNVL